MRRLWPRHVRSRMTLWYVLVLGFLLLAYAGGASLYLFYSLREQLDNDLSEDVERVEGLLENTPDGMVALDSVHHGEDEANMQRFVEVWSAEGALLYRSPTLEGGALGGPPRSSAESNTQRSPSTVRLADGRRVRMATSIHTVDGRRVLLRVAHSEQGLWQELEEFGSVLLVALPLALVLAGLGGFALARKALAPIDAMAHQAERISAERLSERLPIENPEDELGHLARAFNATLARLEAAFDQLRRFTADASHELRTPLTAIRSVGEVALQVPKSATEYRDVIGSMLEETDRLTRLVDSLLTLSRADAGHIQVQRTDISLLGLAQEASSLVEVLAEEKQQRISVEGDPTLIVSGDRLILRQALVNLIDNAIKYSPAEAEILVRVAAGKDSQLIVEVVDQGPGVRQEHQSRIFDRFYRVDSARSREWGGAGLGLAIARWAVEIHGGQITLQSVEGRGSTFRVALPSTPIKEERT
ncbi:MAG: two-component sensor histidine kinase [Acidobacteria bacterium]|nr:MAG: two-component sensor histidine kinase [Acidobacteriota bacterium]